MMKLSQISLILSVCLLGGCNTLSTLISHVNVFDRNAPAGTDTESVVTEDTGEGFIHLASLNDTDEILLTLPSISEDTFVLRRSGQDFVTLSTVPERLKYADYANLDVIIDEPVRPVSQITRIEMPIVETVSVAASTAVKHHAKLEYGTEIPLICQDPVFATDKLADRPNLQVMWENYLYDRPEGIWSEIGGQVEVNGTLPFDKGQWTNACAVRLSHMLLKAGVAIPKVSGATVSGKHGDQYIFRLSDTETFLTDTFGEPDVAILDGSANWYDLPFNTPGIVLMDYPNRSFTGHVTIWNGAGTVDGSEIGGLRVLFWEMPCYIPEDREILYTEVPALRGLRLP